MKKCFIAPIALTLLAIAPIASATINTEVIPYDGIACFAGQPCHVSSQHSIHIINETPETHTYHWSFSMIGVNGDVVDAKGDVTLQPHEEFRRDRFKLEGYMKFNMKGQKDLRCITEGSTMAERAEQVRNTWVTVY